MKNILTPSIGGQTGLAGGLRLLFLTVLISHISYLISTPKANAQNSYSLLTASCEEACGVEHIDGWMGFMCHNLGADTSLDPNTYLVGNIDGSGGTLGYFFQWGRLADGHEPRNRSPIATLSATDVPGHAQFITNPSGSLDWRNPQNDALWGNIKTPSDPCPAGYKVPTHAQITKLSMVPKTWTGNGYRFNTGSDNLFLPAAGNRNEGGTISGVGINGTYWTSTAIGTQAWQYQLSSSSLSLVNYYRVYGFSVRCIAE